MSLFEYIAAAGVIVCSVPVLVMDMIFLFYSFVVSKSERWD